MPTSIFVPAEYFNSYRNLNRSNTLYFTNANETSLTPFCTDTLWTAAAAANSSAPSNHRGEWIPPKSNHIVEGTKTACQLPRLHILLKLVSHYHASASRPTSDATQTFCWSSHLRRIRRDDGDASMVPRRADGPATNIRSDGPPPATSR